MKITEIRIDRTKSLGNYENIKLGFTATVQETEKTVDAIERIKLLLDWEINREERDVQYAAYQTQIASGTVNGNQAQIENWMRTYEQRKAQIEAFA